MQQQRSQRLWQQGRAGPAAGCRRRCRGTAREKRFTQPGTPGRAACVRGSCPALRSPKPLARSPFSHGGAPPSAAGMLCATTALLPPPSPHLLPCPWALQRGGRRARGPGPERRRPGARRRRRRGCTRRLPPLLRRRRPRETGTCRLRNRPVLGVGIGVQGATLLPSSRACAASTNAPAQTAAARCILARASPCPHFTAPSHAQSGTQHAAHAPAHGAAALVW